MGNTEILEKAVQKAIKGGWDYPKESLIVFEDNGHITLTTDYKKWGKALEALIFNHEFAKALWGEEEKKDAVGGSFTGGGVGGWAEVVTKHGWQHHLKEMVVAENPIDYLGKNLG